MPVHAVPHKNSTNQSLPVLCTQTQPGNDVGGFSPVPSTATITIESGDTYQGFRNKKAFWFTGVRYAQFPGRFRYTEVYPGNGSVVPAQLAGPQCLQYGSGSEDCFFLNIETPYIPRVGSTKNLRPVVFWIHGGGFTGWLLDEPNDVMLCVLTELQVGKGLAMAANSRLARMSLL